MTITHQQHPFAEFIRILGRGKRGSRALTFDEAYRAMSMIMHKQLEPEQLGAFLMLMRIKEETPEELAGFIKAAREAITLPDEAFNIDLDWSSYAGKRRHLPWFLLATMLLAENGVRVFMHGTSGHTAGRLYTEDVLRLLGMPVADSLTTVQQQLEQGNFSYLPLQLFCPRLYDIIELRPLMGLRSPVHTLARMLNPLGATHTLQGIFHPGYRALHQEAAQLLHDHTEMAVVKGEGGETERNPDMPCLVQSVQQGELHDETWPALFQRRHIKPEHLDPQLLAAVWQGQAEDEFGLGAVLATTAITLKLLGKASDQQQAHEMAEYYWAQRNKQHISR